jgi:hypothetical protein
MSARIRFQGVLLDSEIPTPASGKASLFYNDPEKVLKVKLDNGSVSLLSVSQEYIEDVVGNLFQDSATIDITYNDAGAIVTLDVIQTALNTLLIPNTPSGNLTSTNTQAALNELQSDIDTINSNAVEVAQDAVGLAINAGTQDGLSVTYDDSLNKIDFTNTDKGSTAVSTHVGLADPHTQYLKESDNLLITPQIINVKISNAGDGEYTDLNNALASITDAADNKHYLIQMGAGEFLVNNPVNIPNYVSITGSTINVTRIIPQNPTQHLLIAGIGTEISFLNLLGDPASIGSGKAAIYVEDGGDFVQLHKLSIYDFDIGVDNLATAGDSVVYLEYVDINGDYLYATRNQSENGFYAKFQHENFYTYPSTNTDINASAILSTGTNADCSIRTAILDGDSNQIGIKFNNGGSIELGSLSLSGFDTAILNDNTGSGSDIKMVASSFSNNTFDVKIDNPATTGQIFGALDKNKIVIDPTSTLSALVLNNGEAGITFNGKLFYAQTDLVDVTDISKLITNTPTMGLISGGNLSDGGGLNLNISSGIGYLIVGSSPNEVIQRKDWNNSVLALSANSDVYVYYTTTNVFTTNSGKPDTTSNILIGRVVTDATNIIYIDKSPLISNHYSNKVDELLRDAIGPVFSSGSLVSESGTRNIDVTNGSYFLSENKFTPAGGVAITFDAYYQSAVPGVYTRVPTQTVISNTQYDDGSGTLASIPVIQYTKHLLLCLGGPSEKYILVYGTATYLTQAQAEAGPLPNLPTFVKDSFVRIASIIVRQGTTNIIDILDERPRIGFASSSSTGGITDHGALSGLADNDHNQYLLRDGTNIMLGNLNMNSNNVINAGSYNTVVVETHASRHLPNGLDPLATGTPSSIGTSNSTGVANALSRQDHIHNHGSQTDPTQHAIATVSANGFMSSTDKTKLDGVQAGATAYDNEQAQDAVGNILTDSSTIDFTYNDVGNTITASVIQSAIDHGTIGGLSDDDHAQYPLLIGRAGGQNLRGGTAASNNLILESTSNVTKGFVILQPNGGNVGIGTSSPSSHKLTLQDLTTSSVRVQTQNSGVSWFSAGNNVSQYLENGVYGSTNNSPIFGDSSFAKSFLLGAAGPLVVGNFTNEPIIFGTNSTGRLKIESAGSINTLDNDIINTLTGLVTSNTVIVATDSIRTAIGKSQGQIDAKANSSITINAGTGLSGGGDLTANRTISMPNVGTAGTFGSATQVPVITTDAQGRVSSVTNTTITGVPAANITNTPAGNIVATNVQTALNELDTEKAKLAGGNAFTGDQSVTTGSVAIGTSTQQASSILTLESTSQGFLLPRMTSAQRLAIASPVAGLMVYDTNLSARCTYSGTHWTFEYDIITTAIQTSTSTTYANITEFVTVSLEPGLYALRLRGIMQSTATGTGVGLRLAADTATISELNVNWTFSQAANGTDKNYEYSQLAAADNITSASTLTANANFPVAGDGIMRISVAGTVAIQIRTETGGTGVSIRPNSTLIFRKVGN